MAKKPSPSGRRLDEGLRCIDRSSLTGFPKFAALIKEIRLSRRERKKDGKQHPQP